MKNLIKFITATIFGLLSLNSFANNNPTKFMKATSVVDVYIETATLGKSLLSKYIFAEDFQHRVNGTQNSKFNKKQIVKFLKDQEGYVQNCKTNYQIIESDKQHSIAKVQMNYDNFTRTDNITMTFTDGSWVINQIDTNYSN